MRFAYTILYVPDVTAALDFYQRAFGFGRKFLHTSCQYGELDTGGTTLAFAAHGLAASNLPGGYRRTDPAEPPPGVEVAFTTDDVPAAVERAVAAGATVAAETTAKPWGQVVAYVRTPDGMLVELCTPAAAPA